MHQPPPSLYQTPLELLRIEISLHLTAPSATLCGGKEKTDMMARQIADEVRANFQAWVERNFFNARAGRIGGVSYARAGELDDVIAADGKREDRRLWYAEAYDRALVDHIEPLRADEADFLLHNPLIALQLALGVTDLRGLRCLRRGLTHEVNRLQARSYRARYYIRDNARRRALAAERRRMTRRMTLNPCPTPEALRTAYAARGTSPEAKIRLGGILEDLECYVDNCLRFGPDGEILGRNGGVKAWLREHVPELFEHYKTLMRYKALAKRLRQATGVRDPIPTSAIFDEPSAPLSATRETKKRDYYALESHLMAARMLVKGCTNTCEALLRAVEATLDGADTGRTDTGRTGRTRTWGVGGNDGVFQTCCVEEREREKKCLRRVLSNAPQTRAGEDGRGAPRAACSGTRLRRDPGTSRSA